MDRTLTLTHTCGGLLLAVVVGAQPAYADDAVMLTVQELVQRLRSDSPQIQSARLQRELAVTGIDRAQAAFRPLLSASISSGYNSQTNTWEETLARRAPDYWRKGVDSSVGVSQLLVAGTRIEAKADLSRFDTNINQLQEGRPDGARDHRSQWSLNLVQPLARDAGTAVTAARTNIARLDAEASEKDLQRIGTTALAEALVAYYELSLAGERLRMAEARIRMGERLRTDAQALFSQGRLPESDVWEVDGALARYRAELSAARQAEREKGNRLKSLVMVSAAEQTRPWRATDSLPPVAAVAPLADQARSTALTRREDLQRMRLMSQRESIQLMYAQNQARPRVDFVTSYGRNGLALEFRDSLAPMRSPVWSVGVQLQVPLGRNLQGEADVAAARARKLDADLKAKSLEVEIVNEVDSALALYEGALQRFAQWRDIVAREDQILEGERRRFEAGRSGTRDVLNREERALNARLGLAEQQLGVAQAGTLLSSVLGILDEAWK